MGDYTPKFSPGLDVTLAAGAAIEGGDLVMVTGANTVSPTSGTTPSWIGVARQDAGNGERVVVTRRGAHRLVAATAIAAGARFVPASAGRVQTLGANPAGDAVGTAMTAAGAGGLVEVMLDR